LIEKWNPPTRSKIAKIGPKNRRNLGVKHANLWLQPLPLIPFTSHCTCLYGCT
jgi:hypothetical protein